MGDANSTDSHFVMAPGVEQASDGHAVLKVDVLKWSGASRIGACICLEELKAGPNSIQQMSY